MPSKTIEDFAYQVRDYMRSAEVVEGKNYLYNNAPTTSTSHNIEFTKNADLTITANGNNTDETAAWVKINENVSLPNNDYVLSGGKSATKNIAFTVGGTVYKDTGNGVQFTINNTVIPEIILYIKGEVDNEVFSPMICTLADWNKSHTYEPYYVPVKDRVDELEDIKTYTIKNGDTAVTGVSVGKLGRWVFMDLTNVNVGTFLGATIPNEIKPLVGCHFFGIVRDTSSSGVQWQGLLDLAVETQVQHIYYTDTYNTLRKKADTTSTNLIISATAVYLSAI